MHNIRLQSINSTQSYAKTHAAEFPKDQITCVSAEEQTAGRGRFHRRWVSPKGNLYATFYFRLPSQTRDLISLAQVMACSASEVLRKKGLHPKIKWPNDILLSGKKVGGILCETQFMGGDVEIFLGIGINVNMDAPLLAEIDQPATSLKVETGRDWDRGKLLQALQVQWIEDLGRFNKGGFVSFRDFLESVLAYKGETVRCFDGKKEWVGLCHSLGVDGQLNLLLEDGTIHRVVSGEVNSIQKP